MKISEVMSTDVETIHVDQSIFEAARMMRDGNYGSLPVEAGDRLKGMITDRDIVIRVIAEEKDPHNVKVGDCLTEGIKYCFEDDSVEDVANQMAELRYRRLPVLSREKRLVGIVSLGDLSQKEDSRSATHEALRQITH